MYMMMGMKDDLFAVIADPTRRHILESLAIERLAVGELVEELGVSQPTVSKHLKVLRNAGLVETEAVGQKRFYSLVPQPLERVTDWVASLQPLPAETRHGQQLHPLSSGAQSAEPEVSPSTPATSVEEKETAEGSVAPERSEPALEPVEVMETAETPEPVEADLPEHESRPEVASPEVSRPQTSQAASSAITFTPFTPFTPADAQSAQTAVADTEPAPTTSEEAQEALPVEATEATAPAEVTDEVASDGNEPSQPLYAEDKLAVPQDDTDERGLFAKLTRLRRRSR